MLVANTAHSSAFDAAVVRSQPLDVLVISQNYGNAFVAAVIHTQNICWLFEMPQVRARHAQFILLHYLNALMCQHAAFAAVVHREVL